MVCDVMKEQHNEPITPDDAADGLLRAAVYLAEIVRKSPLIATQSQFNEAMAQAASFHEKIEWVVGTGVQTLVPRTMLSALLLATVGEEWRTMFDQEEGSTDGFHIGG